VIDDTAERQYRQPESRLRIDALLRSSANSVALHRATLETPRDLFRLLASPDQSHRASFAIGSIWIQPRQLSFTRAGSPGVAGVKTRTPAPSLKGWQCST
jgi:hypothetical protein